MDHSEENKSKKEMLKSYTDYSEQKGTQAKIEQYKKLLDFLIKDCKDLMVKEIRRDGSCLLYTSPSPRDKRQSRMPSSA